MARNVGSGLCMERIANFPAGSAAFPRRVAASSGGTERRQRFVHGENRKLHRDFSGKSPDLCTHLQGGNVDNGLSNRQQLKFMLLLSSNNWG